MYDVIIQCDCGCDKTAQVPQAGALPLGWIGVTWPMRTVAKLSEPPPGVPPGMPIGPGAPQPTIEQRTMVFSSWRCVNKHVKGQLAGEDDKEVH